MSLQPHQERVVKEKDELFDKCIKLESFFATKLFESLPIVEQDRLKKQSKIMKEYLNILNERISVF